jgi:hypothetical protein
VTADSVIKSLLQKALSLTQVPALHPTAGGTPPIGTSLWSRLPPAKAFRLAAAVYPGLRAPPPPGGVLRECLRRHGLIVGWSDLSAAVPELVPDAVALKAVKDAERGQLAEIRQDLLTAAYRVAGRRGLPGTVAWDPARIADPQAALTDLLGGRVTVDRHPPEPEPAFMDPKTWMPLSSVIEDDSEAPPTWGCRRLPKAPSPYVIAGLFKIGERLILDVACRPPPPPPTAQGKAA